MILDNFPRFPFCGGFLRTREESVVSVLNNFTMNTFRHYPFSLGTNLSSESLDMMVSFLQLNLVKIRDFFLMSKI